MKSTKDVFNERGMTLVEILAALVILGIVFVGFMTIFPQMTNFNEKTETKLETMNLAKIELEKLLKESPSDEYLTIIKNDPQGIWTKEYPSGKNTIRAEYSTKAILSPRNENEKKQPVSLYVLTVKVLEGAKVKSETFGYYEVKSSK